MRNRLAANWLVAVVAVALLLPLLVASVRMHGAHWAPFYDMALIEMRVRDVATRHSPLLGIGGRLAKWPEIGCHPGPLSFYALWPMYSLLGRSYWALRTSGLFLNGAAVALALVFARRRAGNAGVIGAGFVMGVLELAFGFLLLAEPWNPYFPVLWFFPFLTAIWSALAGDVVALPVAIAMGSLCAQTHISYALLCGGLSFLGVAFVSVRWIRATREGVPARLFAVAVVSTIALAALLWAPPVLQELTSPRGNFTILFEFFRHPPQSKLGLRTAARLLFEHLDFSSFVFDAFYRPGIYREALGGRMKSGLGVAMFALWGISAGVAFKLGVEVVRSLNVVVGVALLVGLVSTSNIVGAAFVYLMFSLWSIAGAMFVSIFLTVVHVVRTRAASPASFLPYVTLAGAVLVVSSAARLLTTVRVLDNVGSLPVASRMVAEIAPMVVRSLEERHRKEGRHVITWDDAMYGGGAAYGLLVELDRRGVSAFLPADAFNTDLVGAHRVIDPAKATTRLHFANGAWIQKNRDTPGADELAFLDTRTPEEREEYRKIFARLTWKLVQTGHMDVARLLERNLRMALVKELGIYDWIGIERINQIGMPTAIFLFLVP